MVISEKANIGSQITDEEGSKEMGERNNSIETIYENATRKLKMGKLIIKIGDGDSVHLGWSRADTQ